MVSIVSRSEFPDEDDDELESSRPNTHHHLRMGDGKKITLGPSVDPGPPSDARPRGASRAPTEAPPAEPASARVGTTIDGRYFVEKQLGEGGMGVVYLCRHTIIDKRVAMKVLRADLARNQEVTERFLNEARSASSIGNPHIIDISDFGRLPDGATYFVMEFLTGTSVAELVERHEVVEPGRLGHIALQLCEGLAAAHSAGIIHRDLKPDNIFLVNQGSRRDFVKILDFGIAKASHMATKLTQAGQVFGTPHYMSPEQASGAEVDCRSDIYSVGVMLYELSTGQLPFDADNFMAILTQHMYKDPPRPSTIDGLPPLLVGLEALILKCLAKNPAERYQTMVELMSDLRTVFKDVLPLSTHDVRNATSPLATPEQFVKPPSSRPKLRSPIPRKHATLYAIIGLCAALLAGATVWALSGREPRPDVDAPVAVPDQAPPEAVVEPPQVLPPTTRVAIAVSPLDAHVYRGDEDLGESPVVIEVGEDPVTLRAGVDGYQDKTFSVDGSETKLSIALEKKSKKAKAVVPAPRPVVRPAAPKPKRTSSTDGVVNPWE